MLLKKLFLLIFTVVLVVGVYSFAKRILLIDFLTSKEMGQIYNRESQKVDIKRDILSLWRG